MRASAWKDTEARYVVEKDGEKCILSNSMAHAVYELVKEEQEYIKYYDDVRNRMEIHNIDVYKNQYMLEYICKNLTNEIWSDEFMWELEDKNIDWMIENYIKENDYVK